MKLTPHSVITYMEKKYIYVLRKVRQAVVEGKGKSPQDCNSPI